MNSVNINTKPFEGQKPGTSGLRKKTAVFMQEHYTENFVQATLTAMGDRLAGCTLALGGDGRFYSREAAVKIIKMCAGNGVSRVIVGQDGFMSTPALSCVIRKYKIDGGILLTASHNPGGPDQDFGVKFNIANGGPAPASVTDAIYKVTQELTCYLTCPDLDVDISPVGTQVFTVDGRSFTVDVIDPVKDYMELMENIFDFDAIKTLIDGGFRVTANALHGAVGPYVERIMCARLGMPPGDAVKCNVLPDFGGGHPDPNLTYAKELVDEMRRGVYDLGAAFDGDGDRNMIIGKNGFFVSPCDSLAVIAANLECIPYFRQTGVRGYARSMPTSGALDRVAKATGKPFFEVPTGWKFFGNLMDAGQLSVCGEESFGTGSDHIREKDGLWAVLAWLSILAAKKQGVEQILMDHWAKFGRNFFTRYDYENIESAPCETMMANLEGMIEAGSLPGTAFVKGNKTYTVSAMDNFTYTDPIDHSVSKKQGVRVLFEDGSRAVFRLSGTGSAGATVRLYVDSYENNPAKYKRDTQEELKPLVEIALELSQLRELTGRQQPTVIT